VGRFSHSQLSLQEPEKDEYEEVAATEKNYFCGEEQEHAGKKKSLKVDYKTSPSHCDHIQWKAVCWTFSYSHHAK
jgi:hypothetical protein